MVPDEPGTPEVPRLSCIELGARHVVGHPGEFFDGEESNEVVRLRAGVRSLDSFESVVDKLLPSRHAILPPFESFNPVFCVFTCLSLAFEFGTESFVLGFEFGNTGFEGVDSVDNVV
ncbi:MULTISPECIES: hypothetical protein [Haloferax]|uniref:Uncharacterized protein n=1 Tax=Halococcus thailandensis JCM 13552 TaxID=1227457 RepID=M0NG92_9EURY|nr:MULTISPECIES: hypothetical protein [Haloferax]EMA56871.1 hypothetical protein C451_00055 [Halococcus thailandensis JCM 13552]